MRIFVDIDGTICDDTEGYVNAKPRWEYIKKINNLFDEGHIITYWTARGGDSGIDYHELTLKQLTEWGCRYHKLDTTTKPSWDILIDDKTMRIEEL